MPNQQITAQQFMDNLVTLYNDYWSDPAGTFLFDANHTTDLTRRKGWGQDQVKVKGLTETSVAQGHLIEAEHLNSVIAQVNAGLVHIDNSNILLGSVSHGTLITASDVETVRQKITSKIDSSKFICNDDVELSLAESTVSNSGTSWSDDLYIEHTYTFTDYNHARHFFNSGGELTIQLDMNNGASSYNLVWDQIFESFGWIGIGAVDSKVTSDQSYAYQAPNLIPNRGFYSLDHSGEFVTLFETAGAYRNSDNLNGGAYIYAYVQSSYNSRRIRVEAKATETPSNEFEMILRVSLIEDEDDLYNIDGEIISNHGYKIADLSPDNSTQDMNPYTGTPGSTQFRFQPINPPTVSLTTPWTSFDLPSADQVNWDENDPGVNWEPTGTYTFEPKS